VCVVRLGGFVRMDSGAGVNPVVFLGEWNGGIKLIGTLADADGKQGADSSFAGAGEHRVAIFIELREIDVRVGIDQIRHAGLFQPRANGHVFEKAGEDGLTLGPNGGGDDHAVRFHAAQFSRREIHNDNYFAANELFGFVGGGNARNDLAHFGADIHSELQNFVRALDAFSGFHFADAQFDLQEIFNGNLAV
jgi:hypothetical protein